MSATDQIEPSIKKVRGRNKSTIKLIEAIRKIAEEAHPITGRGVGYKLFTARLIESMDKMNVVYRALKVAREDSDIPWEWIVDETRELELIETWRNPAQCADGFFYRRNLCCGIGMTVQQTQINRVDRSTRGAANPKEPIASGNCVPWRIAAIFALTRAREKSRRDASRCG
jgi:hypothetical protein